MNARVPLPKPKLVVVGNGMAGARTLEELQELAPDLYAITVFGAEPHPNYNRILLSPVLAGEQTLDEIVLNSWEWYEENNIRLHAGKKVIEVDRVRRVVRAEDGTEEFLLRGRVPAVDLPAHHRIGHGHHLLS